MHSYDISQELLQGPPAASDVSPGEAVEFSLIRSGYPDLQRIEVTQHEGAICLHGRVHTYYVKQLAQQLAMREPGVHRVVNDIEVR